VRKPDQHRLHHDEPGDRHRDPVHRQRAGAAFDLLHQVAQQPRPDQPGDRGEGVQQQDHGQRARTFPHQGAGVPLDLWCIGDRQGVHASSVRSTVRA
jgi:hypothetical protein